MCVYVWLPYWVRSVLKYHVPKGIFIERYDGRGWEIVESSVAVTYSEEETSRDSNSHRYQFDLPPEAYPFITIQVDAWHVQRVLG